MTFNAFLFQALNGLSSASGLFFVAVGLSLIFGVTRIINIAHGSLYMLGTYLAYSFATSIGGALGFWGGIVATALVIGLIGAAIEIVLLRRIYRAPELFQLLATFALVLVINDAVLWLWGPEDLLGPRAPGLRGAIEVLGRRLPSYDLFLAVVGPLVLLILHLAISRTRFGRLVGAATQDREMVGALGAPVLGLLLCLPLLAPSSPYLLILGIDVLIAVLFATSLHFIMGPGGMHSFGHAAYFGLGAYGAALLVKWLSVPMGIALIASAFVALAGPLLV